MSLCFNPLLVLNVSKSSSLERPRVLGLELESSYYAGALVEYR